MLKALKKTATVVLAALMVANIVFMVSYQTVEASGKTLKVTKQPVSVTKPSGMSVKVPVKASGDGLTYTWYVKNAGSTKFVKSSIKTNTYSVTMSSKVKNRQVYCVIKDKYGKSVKTDTVTLKMGKTLKITQQPVSVTKPSGMSVKVPVSASGDGLTYTWYVKNAGSSKFVKSSIKTNTYSVTMSSKVKNRQVYCVIKDKYGKSVKTDTVTLKMGKTLKITQQPVSVTKPSGMSVKVPVKASGDGLKYTWYVKNAGSSKFVKSSIKTNTYSVTMSSKVKNRQVYCVIKDKYGKSVKTDTVTLKMGNTLKITQQPASVTWPSGMSVKVPVRASGDGLTYTWYVKNAGSTKFVKSSIKTNTYAVTMSSKVKNRQVYCVIKDKYGKSVKTDIVTLKMGKTLKITQQPVSVTNPSGVSAKVSVSVSGDGLTYEWYYKDVSASKFNLTNAFKTNTYSVTMSSANANRQVYCVIKDKYGNSVKTDIVTLKMGKTLKVTQQPVSVTNPSGMSAKVSVSASGDGLTYEWYYKDVSASKFSLDNAFKTNTYSVTMSSTNANRQVYCVIKDKYGKSIKTDTATLKMGKTLKITQQPVSVTNPSGMSAKVSVSASGDGLTYEWYYKDVSASKFSLDNAFKTNTYSVTMSSTNANRQVYCVIKDKYGKSVKTDTVTLKMSSSQSSGSQSPSGPFIDENANPFISSIFAHYDGSYPKIEWQNMEGREGWSAKVVVKDTSGKTVLTEDGIKTNSYTVKNGVSVGQTYTVLVSYESPEGETGLLDGMPQNGIEVVYNRQNGKYYFDGGISLDVLNNYLNRAMTYCHIRGEEFSILKESIVDAGVKYVQRADCAWIPQLWDYQLESQITNTIKNLHALDPEIIFEACIFEYVDENVNRIPIPAETFKAFGLAPVTRNFNYNKMLSPDGQYVNNWGENKSVPNITQLETQMFIYHRACFFIDMGFEAIHLGQVKSIGHGDTNNECWTKVIGMIRDYASTNARRHYVILDAHHPDQKFQDKDGNMLTDFNASPIRMRVADGQFSHAPIEAVPQKCIIEPGHKDSIYKLNISGVSPSGWYTSNYPYLVELDNYGNNVAKLNDASADVWGYDEITWFAIQPQWYRQEFMWYLTTTVDSYNENGHVAVAGKRWITDFPGCDEELTTYYAAGKEGDINYFGDLEFYKDMWNGLGK